MRLRKNHNLLGEELNLRWMNKYETVPTQSRQNGIKDNKR
jgi:hypothetical protein